MISRPLDYSRILCPVSQVSIHLCDCQNCVIARMEEDYQGWLAECDLRFAKFVASVAFGILLFGVVFWAVSR